MNHNTKEGWLRTLIACAVVALLAGCATKQPPADLPVAYHKVCHPDLDGPSAHTIYLATDPNPQHAPEFVQRIFRIEGVEAVDVYPGGLLVRGTNVSREVAIRVPAILTDRALNTVCQ